MFILFPHYATNNVHKWLYNYSSNGRNRSVDTEARCGQRGNRSVDTEARCGQRGNRSVDTEARCGQRGNRSVDTEARCGQRGNRSVDIDVVLCLTPLSTTF